MAKINGTNLAASVVPFTTEDTFATHHAKYGQGGWQEVATIADRDAITPARREAGMAVYVTSESKLYTLNEDLETWSIFETGKIDTISVNGEAQPIEDKNVDITVPTKTSDIENDGDGESPFATEDYVDEFGGKIDTIKVNGVEQEIVDKTVDIAVPTKTSDIDNDSDFQNSTQVQTAIENNIVNNTTSTDTDKSLSAAAGKSLQDQVNNLLGRGKYLSIWDCTTGLAMDEPPVNPYTVETGSYFIVGKIASAGGVNYRPNGGIYDKDVPSTTIETGEVKVNDTYFYDGTVWRLLDVPEKDVAFSSLAGNPRDNDALKAEFEGIESDIAEKADEDSLQAHIDDKDNPHEVTKAQVGLGNVDNTSDLNKPISTATQNALNEKQDTLTAGDNIVIENNVISSTIKESSYIAGENITISPIGYIGAGYKPLLYVQGDGTHYIDTGRPYTSNSVITMYAKGYKTFEGSNSECLAGSSTNSTTESSVGFIANGDKYVGGQLGSRAYSNNTDLEMEEIKLNIPEGKIYFNGTNPITHATTPLNINAYLFAYNRDDEAYKVSEGRIQRYTQVDDGVVVLDYVACVRESDNTVGFYDKVSNTFITCEGLTAGPDISNRFEISATDTTYTAGDNITISENNIISAVFPKYLSVERLDSYLYKATFDSIPEYDPSVIYPVGGGCSSFVRDGRLYRNYDWYYDNTASFMVICKEFQGMASILGMNDGSLDPKKIEQLPYHLVDGVNKSGIKVTTHVLFNDWDYAGAGDKDQDIMLLPYYILSNLHDISDINTVLGDYVSNIKIPEILANSEYLLQFLVTDGTTTYCIIPPKNSTGSYVIENTRSYPRLTNFRWVHDTNIYRSSATLQTRPTGVERWNDINSASCTLKDLRFTKCYEEPTRLSEFIGIDDTTKASTDAALTAIYDRAHAAYQTRTRDGNLWQTVHSVVYGEDSMEHLWCQENWDKDYISLKSSLEPSIVYGNTSNSIPTTYTVGKGLELREYIFPSNMIPREYMAMSNTSYYTPSFTIHSSHKNPHITVVVDVTKTLDTTKTYCIFGSVGGSSSYAFTIEGGKYVAYCGSANGRGTNVTPNTTAGNPDTLELIGNKVYVNGKLVYTFNDVTQFSSGPVFFGSVNGSWGITKTSFGDRLLELKYEHDGQVYYDLIPVTRGEENTDKGFYDVVGGGGFYMPTTTYGDFPTAGPVTEYKNTISAKQYIAGNNITIEDNIISASGKEYVAGDGIIIDDNEISVDPTIKGNRLAEGAGTLLKKDLPYIIANQGQHAEHIRTGMSPDSDFIYLRFRLTETPTGFGGVFGNGTGNNNCSVTVDTSEQTGQLYFYVRYGSFYMGVTPVDTNWHTVMFYSNGVIFDGKIYSIGPSVMYYSDIVLNALKDGNTYYPLKSEISICKVIKRNGNDISTRTYIPAQRSSDGKIGYFLEEDNAWYFSTTGTEYTIDYTGDYGIYVDNKAIQTKLVPDNSIQIIDNELPVGYQEVEEVNFDAIDTGLCVDPALQYKIVMNIKSSYGTNNRRIMGAYTNNDNTSAYIMSLQTEGTDLYYYYAYAQSPSRRKVGSWSSSNWLNIEIIPGVRVKIDGTTTSISGTAAKTDKTIYIGAINGQTFPSVNLPAYGRVTITNNASGYVLFNAIPCLRLQDNTYGMYDTISRRFLQSVTNYKISGRYPVPNIKANVPTYTAGEGINIYNNQISTYKGNWEWTSMGTSSVALGESASAFSYSTALGQNAYANGPYSVSIGSYSQTLGYYDISIGNAAKTNSSEQSIAIGSSSNIYGRYNTTIGAYSYIGDVNNYPNYSLVAGYGAHTLYSNSIVLGHDAQAENTETIVIGHNAQGRSNESIAIGHNTKVNSSYGVAMGYNVSVTGIEGIAIGEAAKVFANNAIQLGAGSNTTVGSLQFKNYPLVDSSGYIPAGRLASFSQTGYEGRVLTIDDHGEPAWLAVDGLPSQTGHSGQYLTTNGTTASWANVAVYTAGNGISINNNVLSAKTDNTTIGFDANGNLKVLEREPEYDPEEEMLIFDWGEDNPKYIEDEEEIVF